MKKIIVVADWAGDTLAVQEVKSAIESFSTEFPNVSFVSCTPSTIHSAFLINQITLTEERFGNATETVIFANTDPRIQISKSAEKAQGAEFVVFKLESGLYICGPNAGHNFSLIKNKVVEIFVYKNFERGSQFRSRDLYSRAVVLLAQGKIDELKLEKSNVSIIPDLRGVYIGHVDNYGNIKTTLPLSSLKSRYQFGETVEITINEVTKQAKFVDNLFGGKVGELVIYPGSSGTRDNPFIEVSVWRHFTEKDIATGLQIFNNPRPGDPIVIS